MVTRDRIQLKIILTAMMVDFAAIVATVFIPPLGVLMFGDASPYAAFLELIIFVLSGAALTFFTIKDKVFGKLRKYLLLAGVSPTGFVVFAVLHNLVSALSNRFFGTPVDEILFFVLATVICPLAFIVGAVGGAARLFYLKD